VRREVVVDEGRKFVTLLCNVITPTLRYAHTLPTTSSSSNNEHHFVMLKKKREKSITDDVYL
jgi:hypothetical protein